MNDSTRNRSHSIRSIAQAVCATTRDPRRQDRWDASTVVRPTMHSSAAATTLPRRADASVAAQRLLEIGDQVAGVLDAHRQAQHIGRRGRAGAFDAGAVLDQALDAAERRRPLPQLDVAPPPRSPPPRRARGVRARGSTACRRSRRASAAPRPRGPGTRQARDTALPRPRDAARSARRSPARWRRPPARAGTACACRASAAMPRTVPRMPPSCARIGADALPERANPRASSARRRSRRSGR